MSSRRPLLVALATAAIALASAWLRLMLVPRFQW